jgi:hypothetical protein
MRTARTFVLCSTATAVAVASTSGCSDVGPFGSSSGTVAFNSAETVASWCLPAKPGSKDIEFSHGNELLTNDGPHTAEVVDVSLTDSEGIDVDYYWFADPDRAYGTLLGWPQTPGTNLAKPYPLRAGASVTFVVHLRAAVMDSAHPPTATGLRVTYRQNGTDHVAESGVGVQLRRRC